MQNLLTFCRKPSLKYCWCVGVLVCLRVGLLVSRCVGLLTVNVDGYTMPFYLNLSSCMRRGEWGERMHPWHSWLRKYIQICWAPGFKHWQIPAWGEKTSSHFPLGLKQWYLRRHAMASKHLWSKQCSLFFPFRVPIYFPWQNAQNKHLQMKIPVS